MKRKVQLLSFVVIGVAAIAGSVEEYPIREIIRCPTQEETYADYLDNGKQLMALKGVPDGDETLVCTNWVCPTSIVVNAQQYLLETNKCLSLTYFKVMTTNDPPEKVASGNIEVKANGKSARCVAFAHKAQVSLSLSDYAPRVVVHGIGSATNMLFVTSRPSRHGYVARSELVYKNIALEIRAPTNAVDFAAAIINAGLPENERVPLPPAP